MWKEDIFSPDGKMSKPAATYCELQTSFTQTGVQNLNFMALSQISEICKTFWEITIQVLWL